jgi:hypothetical protein
MRVAPRLIVALAVIGTVTACKREPTFDERYAVAQKTIREKAGELDKDMATRAADADAIDPTASEPANQAPEHSPAVD